MANIIKSSLARGKWIEALSREWMQMQRGSSLARGKWIEAICGICNFRWRRVSSLARGKWIEAIPRHPFINSSMSSLARGKWIEASCPCGVPPGMSGLPSQEGSGLKLPTMPCPQIRTSSSLARGKWIEAIGDRYPSLIAFVFPRKREVD